MKTSSSRFATLDVIRGLAAMSVFVTHWAAWNRVGADAPAMAGTTASHSGPWVAAMVSLATAFWKGTKIHPGVVCFIVLSGFCIHLPLAKAPANAESRRWWKQYAIRRACRILPVYWLALLLGLCLIVFLRTTPPSGWPTFLRPEILGFDWTALLFSVSVVPPSIVTHTGFLFPGNGPLATVAVEALLYMTYPLLTILRRRVGLWMVLAISAGMYAWYVLLRYTAGANAGPHLTGTYYEFLIYWVLGAAVAEVYVRCNSSRHLKRSCAVTAFAGVLFVLYNFSAARFPEALQVTRALMLAVFMACLLHLAMVYERVHGGAKGVVMRPLMEALRRIGEASYSLYAVHTPVIGAILFVWAGVLGRHLTWPARLWPLIAVAAATGIVHMYVERPSQRFAKRASELCAADLPVMVSAGAGVIQSEPVSVLTGGECL
jgi:peptidoglycan/LPS O-acetylase OafA/YrhL